MTNNTNQQNETERIENLISKHTGYYIGFAEEGRIINGLADDIQSLIQQRVKQERKNDIEYLKECRDNHESKNQFKNGSEVYGYNYAITDLERKTTTEGSSKMDIIADESMPKNAFDLVSGNKRYRFYTDTTEGRATDV